MHYPNADLFYERQKKHVNEQRMSVIRVPFCAKVRTRKQDIRVKQMSGLKEKPQARHVQRQSKILSKSSKTIFL